MADPNDNESEIGQGELIDEGRGNALETVVQQLRLLNELKKGNVPPSRPRLETDKGMEQFLFELAQLTVTTHQNFLKLSNRHFPDIVEVIRAFNNRPSGTPNIAATEMELPEVSGELGDVVSTEKFRVDNPFNTTVHISFGNVSFREVGADDPAAFVVALKFRRAELAPRIDPGKSIELGKKAGDEFYIAIPLEDGFEAGKSYAGTARIFSAGRVVGLLKVRVRVV